MMTDQLMSLEELLSAEQRYQDNGAAIPARICATARAAHEWKADAEGLAQCVRDANSACNELEQKLIDALDDNKNLDHSNKVLREENAKLIARNFEWEEKYDHENPQGIIQYALTEAHHDEHHETEAVLREENNKLQHEVRMYKRSDQAHKEENESLREQLEECQYNRTRDRLGLEQAMCTIPKYIKDEIDRLLCHRFLDMASDLGSEFSTVSKEIYEHLLVSIGSLHQEKESLRQEISKVIKDSQEFLASAFCEKHKDEVAKESFAEFVSKHICERCVKESLAAKDAEIAELRKDAERFRYLRDDAGPEMCVVQTRAQQPLYGASLEISIDAAITAEKDQAK